VAVHAITTQLGALQQGAQGGASCTPASSGSSSSSGAKGAQGGAPSKEATEPKPKPSSESAAITLHDCLLAFLAPELLQGANAYECEECAKAVKERATAAAATAAAAAASVSADMPPATERPTVVRNARCGARGAPA
jgi:hypothetical protein